MMCAHKVFSCESCTDDASIIHPPNGTNSPRAIIIISLTKQVRQLQKSIEDIRINIASKRKAAALDDLKKARGIINTKESQMTASCREAKVCSDILASMKSKMEPLEETLKASADYLNGSDQEREALDKSYGTQDQIQKKLTTLEEQMIPAGERSFQHVGMQSYLLPRTQFVLPQIITWDERVCDACSSRLRGSTPVERTCYC